jgi:pimeloyl-ACP methyl ester carboxylesterase
MVAAQNPGIYCIVSLAGPGVTGAEILCTQTVDIDRAEGMKEPEIAKSLQTNKDIIALISSDADSVKVAKQIKKYVYKENSNLKKDMRESMFMSYNNAMNSSWMKTFVKVDPISYWQKVQCPTLILNGDKDWQVRWDVNANKIAEVLLKNQVPFEKVILAEHNHLFQYSESGKVSEYAKIEESISPETLQTIREWLIKLP